MDSEITDKYTKIHSCICVSVFNECNALKQVQHRNAKEGKAEDPVGIYIGLAILFNFTNVSQYIDYTDLATLLN